MGCASHVDLATGAEESRDLLRLVLGPAGEIAVDVHGRMFGRGAHVHARPSCLDRAVKGGLARSTKGRALFVLAADGARLPMNAASLARAIQEAMDRRIEGLFAAAVRSRQLVHGAETVIEACQRGEASLVIVACDAASAAEPAEVKRAVSEGRAVAWGDKHRLGRMVTLGKSRAADQDVSGVAVVALLSRPLSEDLQQAVRIADACNGKVASIHPRPRSNQGGSRGRTESRGPRAGPPNRDHRVVEVRRGGTETGPKPRLP
ncbi:Hypothetical protein A7982_06400 [Minicystis rosea]|nr:Hypothetical protein A7982_06400 [Minicystis rosea]